MNREEAKKMADEVNMRKYPDVLNWVLDQIRAESCKGEYETKIELSNANSVWYVKEMLESEGFLVSALYVSCGIAVFKVCWGGQI